VSLTIDLPHELLVVRLGNNALRAVCRSPLNWWEWRSSSVNDSFSIHVVSLLIHIIFDSLAVRRSPLNWWEWRLSSVKRPRSAARRPRFHRDRVVGFVWRRLCFHLN